MPTTAENPFLTAALAYAARGWRVAPLHSVLQGGVCTCGKSDCGKSAGKHPRTKNGLKDGTTDEQQIRTWWSNWPRANIAVVCGPESGVWMVGPDGDQGIEDFKSLCAANGSQVEDLDRLAFVSISQSGGRHYIFKWPIDTETIPNRKNHLGTKIDVRAFGGGPGYFVAPPSIGLSGTYRWVLALDYTPSAGEAPEWLVTWAKRDEVKPTVVVSPPATPPASASPAPPRSSTDPADVLKNRIIAYLAKCPASVSGQRGHDDLFRAARALVVGFSLSDAEALTYLNNYFNPRCQPEWDQRELQHKVADARSKPFSKPMGYLRDSANPHMHHPPERELVKPGEATAASLIPADALAPGESWPDPLPLRVVPLAPEFPLDVFPSWLEEFSASAAELNDCPIGYVTANVLGIVATAIGATLSIALTEEWIERSCLYIAVSAPKSSGKTNAFRAAIRPLTKIQAEKSKSDDKAVLFTTDVTVEAIAPLLRDRPRGLLVAPDELSGFIGGMNQYKPGGKGGDRAFWLSCWSGTALSVLRRNPEAPHLWVPHPCVNILGGVQPAILHTVFNTDDGLAERFIFECSDPIPSTRAKRGKYQRADDWHALIKSLTDREMIRNTVNDTLRPFLVALEEDAWEVFADWTSESGGPPDRDETLDGYRSKLRGYAGRFALVLHGILHAGAPSGSVMPKVNAETMQNAVKLCRYYLTQVERVRAGAGGGKTEAEKVLGWMANCGKPAVTRRDIQRAMQRQFPQAEQLAEPLRRLVQHGWIRYADVGNTGGRKPEALYEIRPDLCQHLSPNGGDRCFPCTPRT